MFENCGWLIVTVLTVPDRCVSLSSRTQKAALKSHLLHINSFMHAVYNITANVVLELRHRSEYSAHLGIASVLER